MAKASDFFELPGKVVQFVVNDYIAEELNILRHLIYKCDKTWRLTLKDVNDIKLTDNQSLVNGGPIIYMEHLRDNLEKINLVVDESLLGFTPRRYHECVKEIISEKNNNEYTVDSIHSEVIAMNSVVVGKASILINPEYFKENIVWSCTMREFLKLNPVIKALNDVPCFEVTYCGGEVSIDEVRLMLFEDPKTELNHSTTIFTYTPLKYFNEITGEVVKDIDDVNSMTHNIKSARVKWGINGCKSYKAILTHVRNSFDEIFSKEYLSLYTTVDQHGLITIGDKSFNTSFNYWFVMYQNAFTVVSFRYFKTPVIVNRDASSAHFTVKFLDKDSKETAESFLYNDILPKSRERIVSLIELVENKV